jgi:hypothetical protein
MIIKWQPIQEYQKDPLLDCACYLVKQETTLEDPETGETSTNLHYIHVASPTRSGWWVRNEGFSGMSGGGSCFWLVAPSHFCPMEDPKDE